jgi:inactivated superfamily I helicase
MNSEGFLTQLGYSVNSMLLEQFKRIEANTKDIEKIKKHIIHLHDLLKPFDSYVAMSNSEDYLKIKIEATNSDKIEELKNKIINWAKKYKVNLKKVDGKNTYYIVAFEG